MLWEWYLVKEIVDLLNLVFCRLKFPLSVFLVSCLLLSTVNLGFGSSIELSELYGGSSDDFASLIVYTDDGGFLIAGTTYSFGVGSADFWLIKLYENGTVEWNTTYGGAEADTATSVVQTNDNGYALAGTTSSFGDGDRNFWLVKVDSSGVMQWNQTYGSTESELDSLIQTNDNGYAIVGTTTDNSTEYIWMVKTDSVGNLQWDQTYGGETGQSDVRSVIQTSDGGYMFAGATNVYSKNVAYDAWLVKTDSLGNIQWNQTYDLSEGFDFANDLVQNSDGGYTFAGITGGFMLRDIWVVNTDSNGDMLWNATWHTPEPVYCNCLIQTIDQGYAVTGSTESFDLPDQYGRYMFLIKLDPNGNIQWNSTYSESEYPQNLFVTQTTDGNYALAGTTKTEENTDNNILFFKTDYSGEIIPEFPAWLVLPLTFVAALILVLMKDRKLCTNEP